MIFSLLLQLCHALFAIGLRLQRLLSWVTTARAPEPKAASEILRRSSALSKRPDHIAFVLVGEISVGDLARLVTWSLAADIRNISLYDVDGVIKQRQAELVQSVRRVQERLFTRPEPLQWHAHTSREMPDEPDLDDATSASTGLPQVSLLSLEDGKGDLVRTARALAASVGNGHLEAECIDEGLVGMCLETNKDFPDPDLLVRLGDVDSTMGFLPWQIRLTEIHSLPKWPRLAFQDFFRILQAYSKCEQRKGK